MATTMTHRGITYAQSGSGTTTMNLDLQLQGGVDQDETGWLSGAGAAAGTYPGALTPFAATNDDTINIGSRNPRMVMLTLNGAVADTNTLTLSGDVSKIVSFVAQRADATANVAIVHTSDLVLTFDMEATADGTTDDLTAMELWLVLG
jgi:hypothetical protein|tara:strand:+ start:554 stop:997 length:444 start_codon:yes stop_codon:yes gene_type:complete